MCVTVFSDVADRRLRAGDDHGATRSGGPELAFEAVDLGARQPELGFELAIFLNVPAMCWPSRARIASAMPRRRAGDSPPSASVRTSSSVQIARPRLMGDLLPERF